VCAYAFGFLTDAHEWFERWADRYETWQVDEILTTMALLSAAVAIFSWRRWREANTEIRGREELQKELEHRATHDALTDLPNRALLMDRLEHAIERISRWRVIIAVLFIDLDGFKDINDTFGHEAGDELLAQVARRLNRCVRAADTVSRIGGDEFVLVLEDVGDAEQAVALAVRIMESLSTPFEVGKAAVSVSASIGVVVLDGIAGGKAGDLVREADHAMYRAKEKGGARYEISDSR
jgi:diguanylate cyclase (GGDEF)-like protein